VVETKSLRRRKKRYTVVEASLTQTQKQENKMNLFSKKVVTVDSIVADLNDKVTQLNAHASAQAQAIVDAEAQIVAAMSAKTAAEVEQAKATSVAAKIAALLS
jgi:hypothetical protein